MTLWKHESSFGKAVQFVPHMAVCLSNKVWNHASYFEVTLGDFSGIGTALSNFFVLSFKMSLVISCEILTADNRYIQMETKFHLFQE